MKVYKITVVYPVDKLQERGILCYAVANTDEEIYEFIKGDARDKDEFPRINSLWSDYEENDETYEFKNEIIELQGDTYYPYEDDDFCCERIYVEWEVVSDFITEEYVQIILDAGIDLADARCK